MIVIDTVTLAKVRNPVAAVARVCGGGAHARTIVDVLAGGAGGDGDVCLAERAVGFAVPLGQLGSAELVVVATSSGEPVVVDRQLRSDVTVFAVGAHTVDTRGSCMRMCCWVRSGGVACRLLAKRATVGLDANGDLCDVASIGDSSPHRCKLG